jgi:hypothetical protein
MQLCAIKPCTSWDIRDSCWDIRDSCWHIRDSCYLAQEHEIRNILYVLPAGLQQKKRTDDVALACSVNVAMRDKVVRLRVWPDKVLRLRVWPDVWASHTKSSSTRIFMVLSSAVGAADILLAL